MTQPDFLASYARTKDAEAFAHIVAQYQRLVFAACRRKLHDPADIDDAVQETFLRLARKASQLHTNLGGWLHASAVHVAIDINRRRQSRSRHESAAARGSTAQEDPQNALAELREHLDAALQKLPPDDRELIIQRFFVGSAQVDLAAQAGVASSTISHRLSSAIDRLREHLNAMGCTALTAGGAAALIETLHAEHASASVSQALTANLMKIGLTGIGSAAGISLPLKLLFGFAALVAIGIGGWIILAQLSASPTPMAAMTAPANTPQSPAAVTVYPNPSDQTAPPNWQSTQPSAQRAVLAGRIVDAKGNPIAGATIILSGPAAQTTRTDSNGNYAFRTLRRGAGNFQVSVKADGYVSVEPYFSGEPALQLSNDSQARRDFVLQKGVKLRVRVTNAQNEPVPGAFIDISKPGQRNNGDLFVPPTDDDGKSQYTLPVSANAYSVGVIVKGYAPRHAMIHPTSADTPLDVNLVMEPGLTINGTAICSDNKPAAGWTVSAQPDWWGSNLIPPQAKIDNDGNFTLTSVGPGKYTLFVWSENEGHNVGTMNFPPTTQPIQLAVPIPSPASRVSVTGLIHFVGGDFSGEPPNRLRVLVNGLGAVPFNVSTFADIGPSGQGSDRLRRNEGRFKVNVPPGQYNIRFESPQTEAMVLRQVQIPGDLPLVTLRVTTKLHLTGDVVDAATGESVTHFAIRLRKLKTLGDGPNYQQDSQWTQVSNRRGHFDVECVGPGVYMAQASANGYAWLWSQQVNVEQDHPAPDLKMQLTQGGSLTGIVVDPSGNPVAAAKVIPLSMARTLDMYQQDQFESEAGAVTTDSTGHFLLPHLQPGEETVKVVSADFSPVVIPKLNILEAKITNAGNLKLNLGGTVEGTVFDDHGKPLADVTLNFEDSPVRGWLDMDRSGRLASTLTDAAGHYRVEHLPQQVMWVNLDNLWERKGVVRRVVRPLDGKTALLNFGGAVPVKGRLMARGKPLANKNIMLAVDTDRTGPIVDAANTNDTGDFSFYGPPPGQYILFCPDNPEQSRWHPVRNVQVTGQPTDLGDVVDDVGDVVIHVTYDDPAMASSQKWVRVALRFPSFIGQDFSSDAIAEGDHMRALSVPAGHFLVMADVQGLPGVLGAPFDRKQNTPETDVALHIPKPTATLKLINTAPVQDPQRPPVFAIGNDEGTRQCLINAGNDSLPGMLLPAGTYRILDQTTRQARQDIDPIVLHDGQTTELRRDFSSLLTSGPVPIAIAIWSSDGILLTSPRPRLMDSSGHSIDPAGTEGAGTVFAVMPGKCSVLVDRPTNPAFIQQIDVPSTSNTEFPPKMIPYNIVLPDR